MSDPQYHVRALDSEGNTIRQLPTGFHTLEAADAAALKATRMTGDDHVVCVSLDPKDPANNTREPGKAGWKVLDRTAKV